jgi:pimeloyl-ACP methyl ester carboxylesterase
LFRKIQEKYQKKVILTNQPIGGVMPDFQLGPEDCLFYEYIAPTRENGFTMIFFNALTGDTNNWETVIGPRLREAGHGTLAYNLRGQTNSKFSPGLKLDVDLIVNDAIGLLEEIKPPRPIMVGLSIGGLFAARAWLKGAEAHGLVLINTLRRDGPRLKWIGDALVRAAEVGGLDLFRDLFLPLLMNEEWLENNRSSFLKTGAEYTALSPESGHFKLLAEAGREADWDLPYERLELPVLIVTGLQDHVFLEKDVVNDLFSRIPNGRRVDIPDAGHLIPAERPDALADSLLSFIKEIS